MKIYRKSFRPKRSFAKSIPGAQLLELGHPFRVSEDGQVDVGHVDEPHEAGQAVRQDVRRLVAADVRIAVGLRIQR
jgi:hypothetical protein